MIPLLLPTMHQVLELIFTGYWYLRTLRSKAQREKGENEILESYVVGGNDEEPEGLGLWPRINQVQEKAWFIDWEDRKGELTHKGTGSDGALETTNGRKLS